MIRIWLNHWFSTAYNIIQLIRGGVPGAYIIGSNEHAESPIQAVCDEWYAEPVLKGEDYVNFCLEFCAAHRVDVFMPRREMQAVSKAMDRFAAAGVKVMAEAYPLVSLFADKDRAYRAMREAGVANVPDYRMVETPAQFREAYEELSRAHGQICFKFVRDEGGKSYRLIDNRPRGYASLFKRQTTRISFDEAYAALSERERFSPVMVMPYLPDEEISVDCLATGRGLIAVPRVKDATRVEHVRYDEEILAACARICAQWPLSQPCNIQFKLSKGVAYLLEINTRMSGGVQMACAVSGVNIPAIAVRKLLGEDAPWTLNRVERGVTHVEVPVVLG